MAIAVTCPSCDRKLKAGDELAGRKIKCPKCGAVLAVPEPEPLVETESPVRNESAARQDTQEPSRYRPRPTTQDDEGTPPPKRKKKGILNTDMNEWTEALRNFDVRRFTIIGWLLFAVSIVAAFGGWLVVELNYEAIMDIRKDQRVYTKWFGAYALAVAASGFGVFYAGWVIFYLVGVQVIRPKKEKEDAEPARQEGSAKKSQKKRKPWSTSTLTLIVVLSGLPLALIAVGIAMLVVRLQDRTRAPSPTPLGSAPPAGQIIASGSPEFAAMLADFKADSKTTKFAKRIVTFKMTVGAVKELSKQQYLVTGTGDGVNHVVTFAILPGRFNEEAAELVPGDKVTYIAQPAEYTPGDPPTIKGLGGVIQRVERAAKP